MRQTTLKSPAEKRNGLKWCMVDSGKLVWKTEAWEPDWD